MMPCQMPAIGLFCNELLVKILSRFVMNLDLGLGFGYNIRLQM